MNSQAYWDERFDTDWVSHGGPEQSRFFADLMISNLPTWFNGALREGHLSVADWGCAQGEGTSAWARLVPAERLTGVDFSPPAIRAAQSLFPQIRFVAEDWLEAGAPAETYDVVVSSNTLEHFAQTDRVLGVLAERARKAVVLLVPFNESPRHEEHFATFEATNIPAAIGARFRLVWSRVIDCRAFAKRFWKGEQILLLYATDDIAYAAPRTLADCARETTDWRAIEKHFRLHLEGAMQAAMADAQALEARLAACERELAALREQTKDATSAT